MPTASKEPDEDKTQVTSTRKVRNKVLRTEIEQQRRVRIHETNSLKKAQGSNDKQAFLEKNAINGSKQ